MKVFLALTTLVSLAAARPTCSRRPTPSSSTYGNATTSSTNNSTALSTAGSSNSTSGSRIAAAWYAGWENQAFPPSKIPWDKYSTMIYSFALTTPDINQIQLNEDDSVIQEFVSLAKSNNVTASISLGGWTGSMFFSSAVATPENRTAFTKTLLNFTQTYNFDGINFDWEYPNKQGIGCNVVGQNDTANFLELLKEVRQQCGDKLQLTAAASSLPWNGPDGNPMSNVSEFAQVLDYVAIMAYDVYATWSNVGAGPNAPLQDSCAPTKNQLGSCASFVKAWTDAGIPANQVLLGVPSYGRSYTLTTPIDGDAQKLASFPAFNQDKVPFGTYDTPDSVNATDPCGNVTGPGGEFDYSDLVQRNFINSNGTSSPSGQLYEFDNCSQTAYIYDPSTQVMINFDNTQTFQAKGGFIVQQELAGFALWHIASDTPDFSLTNAILSSI